MPSEHAVAETGLLVQQQQRKACTICHAVLLEEPAHLCPACLPSSPSLPLSPSISPAPNSNNTNIMTNTNTQTVTNNNTNNDDRAPLRIDVDVDMAAPAVTTTSPTMTTTGSSGQAVGNPRARKSLVALKSASLPAGGFAGTSQTQTQAQTLLPTPPPTSSSSSSNHTTPSTSSSSSTSFCHPSPSSSFHTPLSPPAPAPHPAPSPYTDITRLRIQHQNHHCLYPGSTFSGTQKSGKNAYAVRVTIVDVDFRTSWLGGYLQILGLTDDWPELTTYFDAEIVGPRHGFLTQKWGAAEHNDKQHWARFPAFRHVKAEGVRPGLTIPERERGAVFMRWKEKFLVPNHRVQDINGASFAGFYYVCVDFNPPAPAPPVSAPLPAPTAEQQQQGRPRRNSGAHSIPKKHVAPVATMTGYYFHQNSEPFQQLSLHHVPERAVSSFEFR